MTHAFFKALLFLGAGSVIHGMGGIQDLRKMGGLRTAMPWTFRTFLVGGLALAGIPGLSGFFSKDAILWGAWSQPAWGPALWCVGILTAGLTAFYTFRLIFLAFYGGPRYTDADVAHVHESPATMLLPLVVLALLSAFAGYLGVPSVLGGSARIEQFLGPAIGAAEDIGEAAASHAVELAVMGVSVAAALAGLLLARMFYGRPDASLARGAATRFAGPYRILLGRYFIDEIYDAVLVRPLVVLSRSVLWKTIDGGVVDGMVNGTGHTLKNLAEGLRLIQTGYLRTYAALVVVGVALVALWLVI
jgi:NADH-quinone oxidoreductase subunit L